MNADTDFGIESTNQSGYQSTKSQFATQRKSDPFDLRVTTDLLLTTTACSFDQCDLHDAIGTGLITRE